VFSEIFLNAFTTQILCKEGVNDVYFSKSVALQLPRELLCQTCLSVRISLITQIFVIYAKDLEDNQVRGKDHPIQFDSDLFVVLSNSFKKRIRVSHRSGLRDEEV